jgi:hypothetical protein
MQSPPRPLALFQKHEQGSALAFSPDLLHPVNQYQIFREWSPDQP